MNTEAQTSDQSAVIVAAIEQLTSAVLDSRAAPKISLDITLWNTTQIGEYIGVSYRYASEHIVTHHTFPGAIRLPTKTAKNGHPRWHAGEVIAWVSNHKES